MAAVTWLSSRQPRNAASAVQVVANAGPRNAVCRSAAGDIGPTHAEHRPQQHHAIAGCSGIAVTVKIKGGKMDEWLNPVPLWCVAPAPTAQR